ncbi:cell cycle checkpoint protein [Aspergillus sclerotioniger CBS 115572]|uniref:Checkpoint protein n=1 Tax=Aspergillus sclerotioniger CBS 115572 TaxID=1450535 RepID=A0A317W4G9_9EURO|nr:cell cycle checkpoint protein [Aspergillus sclerotioniger CBS 115572]PWY80925.1 cell cycle checkpoint protein [Aspergillus sclerotioniger CBS 115572]
MRFRSQLANASIFSKLTASLSSLGKVCWMRLEGGIVRFTIIPDQGTQVWAQLPVDSIFEEESYILESNTGVINLEVPIGSLHRALRSAVASKSANLRLTKKGNVPLLALTIRATSWTSGSNALGIPENTNTEHPSTTSSTANTNTTTNPRPSGPRERETVITQEIPVKVLHESAVEGLHQPRVRDPDVNILLPSLIHLKGISERFTKLATESKTPSSSTTTTASPKLELAANMHGSLRISIGTDAFRISSTWTDLLNPSLDPGQLGQGELEQLPSERMRGFAADDEAGWARVRIDGKDWSRILSVGRLNPRVVASFINETALVLYVFLPGSWNEEDSCLTYYLNSYAVE